MYLHRCSLRQISPNVPRLDLGMTSDLRNHVIQTILVCLGNEKAFRINTASNLADLNLQPGYMDKANNLHSIFERSTHHLQAPSIVCNMSRTPWLLGWLLI